MNPLLFCMVLSCLERGKHHGVFKNKLKVSHCLSMFNQTIFMYIIYIVFIVIYIHTHIYIYIHILIILMYHGISLEHFGTGTRIWTSKTKKQQCCTGFWYVLIFSKRLFIYPVGNWQDIDMQLMMLMAPPNLQLLSHLTSLMVNRARAIQIWGETGPLKSTVVPGRKVLGKALRLRKKSSWIQAFQTIKLSKK